MEPNSGRVLAMVGGYSFSLSNFNRSTQAMRQPGSAFKPIVYAAALENGYTPASVVMDSAITLTGRDGENWTPENYNKKYYGALQLRKGLELSRNAMTVRLAQGVGMRKISDLAVRLGVVKSMDPVLAMALGAGETTPFKLTAAYASFVNGGRKVEPHLIEMVEDGQGKVIFRADKRDCFRCGVGFNGDESPRIAPGGAQMMDPITAYQITSMLQGVVQRGTATAVGVLGRPVGGKTGTTNEYRSAWFVGFTPQIVAGVFVGYDDNRSLGEGETGTVAAVPIFTEFMAEATKNLPKADFKAPKNAKFAMIRGIREAFRPGTEPKVMDVLPNGLPAGPVPYTAVLPSGELVPAPQLAPPPKKDDMNGLY
jgi:penicillin-binding protein 1A